MHMVSASEKASMEARREDLFKLKLEVQDRITKAAALGDLKENSEYHFAKEENRSIERELKDLEAKIKNAMVASPDDVPVDMVFLGDTVKLLDTDDESEQMIRLVGDAQPPGKDDVVPVSVSSPMGEALLKARIGDVVKVRAPRGTMEFKILEIIR